eukprot:361515_1
MDADSLSLLIILKQELKDISNSLTQPQPEIIEDIMTDNGLNDDNQNNDVNNEHDQKEDEKAPELKQQITKSPSKNINCNELGFRIDDLIENYLIPTIKQLNKKRKKKNKKKKSDINRYYSSHTDTQITQLESYHNDSLSSSQLSEPGQVIDHMSNYSEKLGNCCRKFVTSLFCGCGIFQSIGIFVVIMMFGLMFVFYNASEITLILKELNHWKELSVKRVEYELTNSENMAKFNFDMDVDIDKLKQEHKHIEYMEIIKAKKSLTKEFIDKNTRTVITTYWNFLTTETETVSQTIFSEEDIAFFQNNILYYGFNIDNAIESPKDINTNQNKDNNHKEIDDNNTNINSNDDTTQCI